MGSVMIGNLLWCGFHGVTDCARHPFLAGVSGDDFLCEIGRWRVATPSLFSLCCKDVICSVIPIRVYHLLVDRKVAPAIVGRTLACGRSYGIEITDQACLGKPMAATCCSASFGIIHVFIVKLTPASWATASK